MRNRIKSSREVQKYTVSIKLLIYINKQVIGKRQELGFAGKEFSKSMLCVVKERIHLEEINEV